VQTLQWRYLKWVSRFVDADIYGPSAPIMFDIVNEKPLPQLMTVSLHETYRELRSVKNLSIGFFKQVQTRGRCMARTFTAAKALNQMIYPA
jgi:ATP-binding protein involved in chromosome partitioning